ncbi:uncharacterized protein B0H64DRAFT_323391 [Chaetomium fimeti]|uniref:Uncharacterized protein n=1 Tax=Chaetomium fimeti TaxID=1854472 RepID=A0AAE0HFE4_9PEZI|nr:hypothetical protein B0H64DRAFT_323391 [Chaetomium fimeti]
MSALEVAQDKMADALRAKILHLEAEFRGVGDALRRERSKSWNLTYQCQDLREEVWRLTMHLSHSITVSDWEEDPLVPKTARERALEEKMRELEKRVRELKDKARDRDVKIGNTEGTGRARSKSMGLWTIGYSRNPSQAGRVPVLQPLRVPWARSELFAGTMPLANAIRHPARKQ